MTIDRSRAEPLARARVVAQHRGRYVVRDATGDHDAILSGSYRHRAVSAEETPAVGDWVETTLPDPNESVRQIRGLVPRTSAFLRKMPGTATEAQVIAANVDLAIVATALPHDVSLRRIERYLALAWESGAMPLVVLTKADLVDDVAPSLGSVRAVAPGVDVMALSTITGDGVAELRGRLGAGTTAVILGSSGVGKSTLVNALVGTEHQRTAEVRGNGTGRHTTTHRELIDLPGGGSLIDTPGMREVQLWATDDGLETAFDDIATVARECRFHDCSHGAEPGCAVQSAVSSGALSEERLDSWRALGRELAYLERRRDAAATAAARQHTKSLIRALRARLRDKYE
jgi:ribosome biogenesis GTPase / thiamine phosphate phosphatase